MILPILYAYIHGNNLVNEPLGPLSLVAGLSFYKEGAGLYLLEHRKVFYLAEVQDGDEHVSEISGERLEAFCKQLLETHAGSPYRVDAFIAREDFFPTPLTCCQADLKAVARAEQDARGEAAWAAYRASEEFEQDFAFEDLPF